MKHYRIATLFVCLAASPLMRAQDPVGAIEGLVTEKSENPVGGARIIAKSLDTGCIKQVLTGTDGLFRIPLVPVGSYSLTVDAPNFATLVQGPITINVSQTVRVELKLTIAAIKSTVTVVAESPLTDASTNTLGAR